MDEVNRNVAQADEDATLAETVARATVLRHEIGLTVQAMAGANASFGGHLAYLSETRLLMYDQFWAELGKIYVGPDGIHSVRDSEKSRIAAEENTQKGRIVEKAQPFVEAIERELATALSSIASIVSGRATHWSMDAEMVRNSYGPTGTTACKGE